MDLRTHYLGMALRNPLVASPSPLTNSVEGVRALADAGIGAVVLPSLFEEEVHREQLRELHLAERYEDTFSEARSFFPTAAGLVPGTATRYLSLLERAVAAVDVPVMASLNASHNGSWAEFAHSMQEAGAAAIELNIYLVPGDPHMSGREVEDRHVEFLQHVRSAVTIPVAVKVSPHFSSPGEVLLRLDDAGADGLVLFNRFIHPDVDCEKLAVVPGAGLSHPEEARLPRAWIAILHGRTAGSLAATSGVDGSDDVAAYLLAGADVVMTASALLRYGLDHIGALLDGLTSWLDRKGFVSVGNARGLLAVPAGVDEAAYERAGYVAALERARERYAPLMSP